MIKSARPQQLTFKILWFAAVLLALVDYTTFVRSTEQHIDETITSTAEIELNLRRNAATLERKTPLEEQCRHLANQLRQYNINADRTTTIALFLREAARVASVNHVVIRSIDASHAVDSTAQRLLEPDTLANSRDSLSTAVLEPIPLDIQFRASYRDLLSFIRGISHAHIVARVDLRSIAKAKGTAGTSPPLDAWITASVEHTAAGSRSRAVAQTSRTP